MTRGALLVACVATAALVAWLRPNAPSAPAVPEPSQRADLATSRACRSCHPAEYASWWRSYHRTMTQAATPDTVLGDFEGVTLRDRGRGVRLERDGHAFQVHVLDNDGAVTQTGRVALTTGAHHFQYYWVRLPEGFFVQVPWLWWVAAGRWIPVEDSFLQPGKPTPDPPVVWNASCSLCHTVAAAPALRPDGAETHVGELGIACEACHGPGKDHAARHRNPFARYATRGADDDDPTIVDPAGLPPGRANALCARCHALFDRRGRPDGTEGDPMWPGDALEPSRALIQVRPPPPGERVALLPPAPGHTPTVEILRSGQRQTARVVAAGRRGLHLAGLAERRGPATADFQDTRLTGWLEPYEQDGEALARLRVATGPDDAADRLRRLLGYTESGPGERELSGFWPDGTVRIVGREYNGMTLSRCMEGGLTCLECHSMHRFEAPADQLAPDAVGDEACLRCHEGLDPRRHSHHDGVACYDCHMPHTTYGLLRAQRSHRVDSPDPALDARHGRPNACNLCHLDRSLAWTAARLHEWYDTPIEVRGPEAEIPYGPLRLGGGDAA